MDLGRTISPASTIYTLTIVDLADANLQARQGILKALLPPLLLTPIHPKIRYMLIPPLLAEPPSTLNPPTVLVQRWGDNLWSIVRICNITTVEDLPHIWRTIAPLLCDRAWAAMEEA